jgi:hypothetical protein
MKPQSPAWGVSLSPSSRALLLFLIYAPSSII